MASKYRVLGTNDDASDCLCCGRQGLKRVVWMQPLAEDGDDDGQPVHFGTTCAGRAAGWGYGTDADRCKRRIDKEAAETRKHYGRVCSGIVAELEASGAVVRSRVALGFNWKDAAHTYGYIFTLPGDPIIRVADPVLQAAEIRNAKARLREAFPVFRVFDAHLNAMQLRELATRAARAVA